MEIVTAGRPALLDRLRPAVALCLVLVLLPACSNAHPGAVDSGVSDSGPSEGLEPLTGTTSDDECGEMAFTKDGLWSDANEHVDHCCETDQCGVPSTASTTGAKFKCADSEDVQPPTATLARVRRRRNGGAATAEVAEFFTKLTKSRYATLLVAATCSDVAYQKHVPEIDSFIKSVAFADAKREKR